MRPQAVLALLLAACPQDAPGNGAADAAPPDAPGPDAPPTPIYVHSDTTLYELDRVTLATRPVAEFIKPETSPIADLALDDAGRLTAVSFTHVYTVDPATAKCTVLGMLDKSFNALAWTRDAAGNPILVGAAGDGELRRFDPVTGDTTPIGSYGTGITSSGDIAWAGGLYATTRMGLTGNDALARVEIATGSVTMIGDTGRISIWALLTVGGELHGLTNTGEIVRLDTTTGAATTVDTVAGVVFWGAASPP